MTYDELVAILQGYTEDTGDLVDELPGIVERAEIRISKDLNIDAMNEIATAPITGGTYWVGKPADWVATLELTFLDGTDRIPLESTTESLANDYWRDRTQTGVPRFYANWDQDWFLVVPPADKSYTAEIKYEARIAGLSSGTQTTWISLIHPDLLLACCLCESATFHKGAANKELYETDYAKILKRTQDEVVRQRSDATNLRRKGR